MEESTSTIATTTTTAAVIETSATSITKPIVMLIVVETVPVLESIVAATMIRIIEALETRLVICSAIVVWSELSFTVITSVARPTATATPSV